MLLWVLDVLKDLAVIAAAAAVVLIARRWYATATSRDDAAATSMRLAEQQIREAKDAAAKLDAALESLTRRVEALAGPHAAAETRTAIQVRVHAMLQATRDPFLTFVEIERGLAAPVAPPASDFAGPSSVPAAAGDALRRVLMEMVRDGVIAQLDRDRYFIASDFETEDGSHVHEGDA